MGVMPEIEEIHIVFESEPDIVLVGSAQLGPQGPQGPPGQWTALTQAEYNELSPPDPEMLYVIIT